MTWTGQTHAVQRCVVRQRTRRSGASDGCRVMLSTPVERRNSRGERIKQVRRRMGPHDRQMKNHGDYHTNMMPSVLVLQTAGWFPVPSVSPRLFLD